MMRPAEQDIEFVRGTVDLQPVITHSLDALKRADGNYEQVYNFYDYLFSDLPDAGDVRARVYFGEKIVHLTGISPGKSPKSVNALIEYFRSRMFQEIECLSPEASEIDPVKGYRTIWSAK